MNQLILHIRLMGFQREERPLPENLRETGEDKKMIEEAAYEMV